MDPTYPLASLFSVQTFLRDFIDKMSLLQTARQDVASAKKRLQAAEIKKTKCQTIVAGTKAKILLPFQRLSLGDMKLSQLVSFVALNPKSYPPLSGDQKHSIAEIIDFLQRYGKDLIKSHSGNYLCSKFHILGVDFLTRYPGIKQDRVRDVQEAEARLLQLVQANEEADVFACFDEPPVKKEPTLEDDPCCICTEDLESKAWISITCGHRFHSDCIGYWLLEHSSCPICRAQVTSQCGYCHKSFSEDSPDVMKQIIRPCNHVFHAECIEECRNDINTLSECPFCEQDQPVLEEYQA
jgi:hypothetical protein